MYFPKKYNHKLAIENGRLVAEAYDQFSSYEKKEKWKISKGYELISEIFIQSKKNINNDKSDNKIAILRNLFPTLKDTIEIPIGFVAVKGDSSYLVFRGTKTASEWINNF